MLLGKSIRNRNQLDEERNHVDNSLVGLWYHNCKEAQFKKRVRITRGPFQFILDTFFVMLDAMFSFLARNALSLVPGFSE